MKEGKKEGGIYIGNQIDKSDIENPIGRFLVRRFDAALMAALVDLNPQSIHEVGCGEARLSKMIASNLGVPVFATDFSESIVRNNTENGIHGVEFECKSIYDLDAETDPRDIIMCCEVLEHLEYPEEGLGKLCELGARSYIFSVPREPTWRWLNLIRGAYVANLGNTPGHLNHWSKASFASFLAEGGFEVLQWHNPFPWLMVTAKVNSECRNQVKRH